MPGRAPAVEASTDTGGLDRSLGLWHLTASGVGIIVGAGIYVLIGSATELAGARVWMAFVVTGILSGLTAMSYAELAAMFPRAGAEFEYSRHAYSPATAFLVGWVMVVGLIVAATAVALGFGRYAGHFFDVSPRVAALGLLAVVALVALSGVRRSATLTVLLSIAQVGGLLFVIAIGAAHLGKADLLSAQGGTGSILSAAALVFFAFIGFDEVITLAEETRDPTRTVPAALLLALGISTVLYIGVAIASVSTIGATKLGGSQRPLADVLDHVLGGRGADVIAVAALIATTNTTLLCITASSRLQYGMAQANALPSAFGRLTARTHTPAIGIVVSTVIAAGCLLLGNITLIASVTDLAVYLVFIAVNLAVIILRYRMPERDRPFRIKGAIGKVPITPVLGLLTVALLIPQLEWRALALGGALCAVGLGLRAVFTRQARG